MLEHGAYTLLLDRYYATEKGIPCDQVYRVARANTKAEKRAVDTVLREFFTLAEDFWKKNRCEEEIAAAHSRINTARENGKLGGRPKTQQNQRDDKPSGLIPEKGSVSSGLAVGSENKTQHITQTKALQTPDSNLQTPERRRKKEEAPAEPPPFDPGTVLGLDLEAWRLWLEHRKAIKKPIRPHSMPDAAEVLAKLGNQQLAEVKRARAGGWQGLHPEKINGSPGRPYKTKYELATEALGETEDVGFG